MVLCRRIAIDIDYTLLGKLQNELSKQDGIICGEAEYTDRVKLPVFVPEGRVDGFCAMITDKPVSYTHLDVYKRQLLCRVN